MTKSHANSLILFNIPKTVSITTWTVPLSLGKLFNSTSISHLLLLLLSISFLLTKENSDRLIEIYSSHTATEKKIISDFGKFPSTTFRKFPWPFAVSKTYKNRGLWLMWLVPTGFVEKLRKTVVCSIETIYHFLPRPRLT